MPILPSGLVIPDVPYLLALGLGAVLTTLLLLGLEPPVTKQYVIALMPWMAVGGMAHAFYEISIPPTVTSPPGLYPEWVAPLFSAPSVYVTLYVVVGTIWLALHMYGTMAGRIHRVGTYLGAVGSGVLIVFVTATVWQGLTIGFSPLWPTVGFVLSVAVTTVTYVLLSLRWTGAIAKTGLAGAGVVFAHAFDGLTTMIGIDLLAVTERTPIPAAIMDFAGSLPTASYLGSGWLFVLVKLLVASIIVIAVAEYVDEQPTEGSLFLIVVTAVGLGPAANNFVLFSLGV